MFPLSVKKVKMRPPTIGSTQSNLDCFKIFINFFSVAVTSLLTPYTRLYNYNTAVLYLLIVATSYKQYLDSNSWEPKEVPFCIASKGRRQSRNVSDIIKTLQNMYSLGLQSSFHRLWIGTSSSRDPLKLVPAEHEIPIVLTRDPISLIQVRFSQQRRGVLFR